MFNPKSVLLFGFLYRIKNGDFFAAGARIFTAAYSLDYEYLNCTDGLIFWLTASV